MKVIGGRYKLLEELGSGGFGRVWKAYDEVLRVDVAIKEVLVRPELAAAARSKLLERAKREARNAARLRDNPHVVAVHDVVMEDGAPWLVMRLVDGCSLEKRLSDRGRLPAGEAVQIATGLLKALRAAHAANIVHRDIKPGNVLLANDGQVLLSDFGIAVQENDTQLTSAQGPVGTLVYTAPERLAGHEGDPASDMFSLGATLYTAVEGTLPFRGDTPAAVIHAILHGEPAPPKHGGILAPVIIELLNKDPRKRPVPSEALRLLGNTPAQPATAAPMAEATKTIPPPPVAFAPPPARTAMIVVSRRWRSQLATQAFDVLIDGTCAGRVRNGASEKFSVEPGSHSVALRAPEHQSTNVTVSLAAGERRELTAAALLVGAKVAGLGLKPKLAGRASAKSPVTGDRATVPILAKLLAVTLAIIVLVLVTLYHKDRSFAYALSGQGGFSGDASKVSVGGCLHYLPGTKVTWVSVPCFAASADYRVTARISVPWPATEPYRSFCPSAPATYALYAPVLGSTDGLELCLAEKQPFWNPAG